MCITPVPWGPARWHCKGESAVVRHAPAVSCLRTGSAEGEGVVAWPGALRPVSVTRGAVEGWDVQSIRRWDVAVMQGVYQGRTGGTQSGRSGVPYRCAHG